MTYVRQGFYCKNKTRLWQENLPKTGVEHIEDNVRFYIYLYSLGTYLKEAFLKTSNLHVTHVHPCVAHVHPCEN